MTSASLSLGVTAAPFRGRGPMAALDLCRQAESLGYESFWMAEVTGPEAFSVLGAASQLAPRLSLGTGVLAMQLRSAPLLAMAAASLQAMAPDRDVLLGVGVSSPVVAGNWHGAAYGDRPLARMREFVTLLRECLSGDPVTFTGDFYSVRGYRLDIPPGPRMPKIILGALNERMLRLAGEIADGVLLNYLPAAHVPWSVEQVRKGGDATIYANIHVGFGDQRDVDDLARKDLFAYIVVDSYARHFRRAGYGDVVDAVLSAHAVGDRTAALAAISQTMIDDIDVVGDATLIRSTVETYHKAGVDVPVLFPLPWGPDPAVAVANTLRAALGSG